MLKHSLGFGALVAALVLASCGDDGAEPTGASGSGASSGTGTGGAGGTGVGGAGGAGGAGGTGTGGAGGTGTGGAGGTGTGGAGGAGGAGGGMECANPLDEATLQALAFGFFDNIALQPGQSNDFDLGTLECCYFFTPVDACAVFSIDPVDGATIDPASGLFTVAADTPSGTVYTVTADIEEGRRLMTTEVYVYTPEAAPLVGFWSEVTQLSCGGGEVPADPSIAELWFKADGTFSVTWFPFELYFDYWGTYTFDLAAGTLNLVVEGGNFVPPDIDGDGTFSVVGGDLVLSDIWLGSHGNFMGDVACGHRFQ